MKSLTRVFRFIPLLVLLLCAPLPANGQPDVIRLNSVEARVTQLERNGNRLSIGTFAFFVGVFCALWAQNTKRSAWLWFFLGFFFNAITLLFLLYKNSQDLRRKRASGG